MSNENKKTQFSKLTIQDLVNINYEELRKKDKNELLRLTREINRFAKNRYERTKKWLSSMDNLAIPTAFRETYDKKKTKTKEDRLNFKLSNEKISSKQSRNYLLERYMNAKRFLLTKTSTVSGWKKSLDKFTKSISEKTKISINIEELKYKDMLSLMYKLYKKLKSADVGWKNLDSSQAFVNIITTIKNTKIKDFDELYKILIDKAEDIYEENITKDNIEDIEDFEDFEDFTPDWR